MAREIATPIIFEETSASSVAAAHKQGPKYRQEDAVACFTSASRRVVACADFDGHGEEGKASSVHCRSGFLEFMRTYESVFDTWTPEEWSARLDELFDHLHSSLRDSLVANSAGEYYADAAGVLRYVSGAKKDRAVHGGTTASIVVYAENTNGDRFVVCANVGDSDVLFLPPRGLCSKISEDHDPTNADEWQRIHVRDAELYEHKLQFVYERQGMPQSQYPQVFDEHGQLVRAYVESPWAMGLAPANLRYEPGSRVVSGPEVENDAASFAMTRSIGDFFAHLYGLTHRPAIRVHRLPAGASGLVVLASDGVWDCWQYQTFADKVYATVEASASLQDATAELLKDNHKLAVETFGVRGHDDASIALMRIPAPAARAC